MTVAMAMFSSIKNAPNAHKIAPMIHLQGFVHATLVISLSLIVVFQNVASIKFCRMAGASVKMVIIEIVSTNVYLPKDVLTIR